VTEADGVEAVLVPSEFVAVTVHVYPIPLVSPVTTTGLVLPEIVLVPHVAVYPVIAGPPVEFAVNATAICPFPGVAERMLGAAGGVL
jgi:hypothetical protein